MPIYNFRCEECGRSFDLLVGAPNEERKIKCSHCGSKRVEKNLTTFGIKGGNSLSSDNSSGGSCCSGTCPSCF